MVWRRKNDMRMGHFIASADRQRFRRSHVAPDYQAAAFFAFSC